MAQQSGEGLVVTRDVNTEPSEPFRGPNGAVYGLCFCIFLFHSIAVADKDLINPIMITILILDSFPGSLQG
jgi:hypothetical protein